MAGFRVKRSRSQMTFLCAARPGGNLDFRTPNFIMYAIRSWPAAGDSTRSVRRGPGDPKVLAIGFAQAGDKDIESHHREGGLGLPGRGREVSDSHSASSIGFEGGDSKRAI
jgi:hypothetical protein